MANVENKLDILEDKNGNENINAEAEVENIW